MTETTDSSLTPPADLWMTSSQEARPQALSVPPSDVSPRGLLQGNVASRPEVLPLLRRRLMLVAALAIGACIAALLTDFLALGGTEVPADLQIQTRHWLVVACLGSNALLLLVLWLWKRAPSAALHGLDALLFLSNLIPIAAVPLLLFGPEHIDGQTVGTVLLMRCIFIPDSPLRTLLLCGGIWLLYGLVCVLSLQAFAGEAPRLLVPGALWPRIVEEHFTIGLNLAIGLVAVQTIYGLRLRLFQVERAGSYRLLEKLGEGGMGEVWRARHALLQRPTAVKMLRADLVDSPTALRRFEREVRAVSELTDPHTIVIYDCGKTDGGRFYYAMEFLEGLDLQALVERFGPLPPQRAVFVFAQVLQSLAEAHHRGILHRDIKPSNVFLTTRGTQFDFVKVLDFGLVKHLEKLPDSRAMTLTADDTLTGSPLYLAPEWVYGEGTASHGADLYSAGALAYFLLSGRPVFASKSPMAALVDHVKTPPMSLRQRDVPISEALDRIVLKALEKQPEERFLSAEAFLVALRETPEWGVWTSEQAADWWQRNLPIETLLSSQPIFAAT